MAKCEKCGHFNPYWRADWRDTEREFARAEDILANESFPEDLITRLDHSPFPKRVIVLFNGFAWKLTKKYIRRMPIEIYESRGRWGLPYKAKDYFDATSRPSNLGAVRHGAT